MQLPLAVLYHMKLRSNRFSITGMENEFMATWEQWRRLFIGDLISIQVGHMKYSHTVQTSSGTWDEDEQLINHRNVLIWFQTVWLTAFCYPSLSATRTTLHHLNYCYTLWLLYISYGVKHVLSNVCTATARTSSCESWRAHYDLCLLYDQMERDAF